MSLLDLAHSIFESTEFGSDFLIELVMIVLLFSILESIGNMLNTK